MDMASGFAASPEMRLDRGSGWKEPDVTLPFGQVSMCAMSLMCILNKTQENNCDQYHVCAGICFLRINTESSVI